MNLSLYQKDVLESYTSNSQRIRVLSENWMGKNMFCPKCLHSRLVPFPNNNPVADFSCPNCKEQYQLKSQKTGFWNKINDGAYRVMIESITNNTRPNFFLLQYQLDYLIKNLFLIPSFFFTVELIEKRKPLSESARRAGWTGCNILIDKIPPEGRISIIHEGIVNKKETVTESWRKVEFLRAASPAERTWTIDVLQIVHSLKKREFTLDEIYQHENKLKALHPSNFHVRDKIRQQLQVLRDKNLLIFLGNGNYSLK